MDFISQNKDTLDLILQLFLIIVPVVISWFIRTYVKNTAAEKQLGAIVRLSNAAIDYVENLDKRGDLVIPPDIRRGLAKLNVASDWMESMLDRNGIKITNEEAKKWIASEYQKRVGNPLPESDLAEQAKIAVNLIQAVEGGRFNQLLQQPDRLVFLSKFAADWVVSQLAHNLSANISQADALSWVNAEILQRSQPTSLPTSSLLAGGLPTDLARQAVAFMQDLKARGLLTVAPGVSPTAVERDIAVAWMMTEAARQGRAVSPQEIALAVTEALRSLAGPVPPANTTPAPGT